MKKLNLSRALAFAVPFGFFLACGDNSGPGESCSGAERCACETDADCHDGLECRSELCVDPDSRNPEDTRWIGGGAGEGSMDGPDPDGTGSTGGNGSGGGGSGSGGSGSGGAASGGNSGFSTPCLTDDACVPEGKVCRTTFRHCVECNDDPDCPADHSCHRGECLPIEFTCETSRDCPENAAICAQDHYLGGYCVECRYNDECPVGTNCHFGKCQPTCTEDDECATGLQCVGTCVDCYAEDGCEAGEYCWGQICKPMVCDPGTFRCAGNTLVECNQYGSGYFNGPSCVGYPCTEESGQGACEVPMNPPPVGALNTNGDFSGDAPEWQANGNPINLISEMACYEAYQVIGWPADVDDATTLVNGESYELVFRTSVVKDTPSALALLGIKVGGPEDPYPTFFEQTSIALSEGHEQHSYSFTMNGSTGSAGIAITFGASTSLICVDDVWILPN